jgi:hypothetical protein
MVCEGVLMRSIGLVLVATVTALLATSCRPSEPLTITTIQTGKSLNSDNSIATHTTRFAPKDSIHVSVLTGARGSGTIVARLRFAGGGVINEQTKEVSYNDQAATDFRFQAADGFPPGEYTIEVSLDGKPSETRNVRVE